MFSTVYMTIAKKLHWIELNNRVLILPLISGLTKEANFPDNSYALTFEWANPFNGTRAQKIFCRRLSIVVAPGTIGRRKYYEGRLSIQRASNSYSIRGISQIDKREHRIYSSVTIFFCNSHVSFIILHCHPLFLIWSCWGCCF